VVAKVQRRRGPEGWADSQSHLPWPSGISATQIMLWKKEYSDAISRKEKFGMTSKQILEALKSISEGAEDVDGYDNAYRVYKYGITAIIAALEVENDSPSN